MNIAPFPFLWRIKLNTCFTSLSIVNTQKYRAERTNSAA